MEVVLTVTTYLLSLMSTLRVTAILKGCGLTVVTVVTIAAIVVIIMDVMDMVCASSLGGTHRVPLKTIATEDGTTMVGSAAETGVIFVVMDPRLPLRLAPGGARDRSLGRRLLVSHATPVIEPVSARYRNHPAAVASRLPQWT